MQIGYIVDVKRRQKEWFIDLLNEAGRRGYHMISLDEENTDFNILDNKLDVLIHKSSHLLVSKNPQHQEFIAKLENFLKRHPWIYVADPLDAVRKVLNRKTIKQQLEGLEIPCNKHYIKQPKWQCISSLQDTVNLKYPIVYKPIIADGSNDSHDVGIIFNRKGLEELESNFPLVCEEFHNHDAILIKIYVMGGKFSVMYRRSVENLDPKINTKTHESFGRISSQNSNKDSPLCASDINGTITPLETEAILPLLNQLHQRLGINFYGVDLVLDSTTKDYYLIDINYLPGFYDLQNVGASFLDFIIHQARKRFNRPLSKCIPSKVEMNRSNTMLIFDIDGTIAPKGGHVDQYMRRLLLELQEKVTIGLITGGTLVRTKERLGDDVCSKYEWIFTENSLITYKKGVLTDPKNIREILSVEQTNEIISWVLKYLSNLQLPILRGTFVDFRNGLINISPAGRFHDPSEEKKLWVDFDKKHNIRTKMVEEMKKVFGHLNLEWVIGGDMGFDIFPKGWDKSIVLRFTHGFDHLFYFGDHTDPKEFGNDYLLFAHEKTFGFSVDGPEDTASLIKNIFF